MDSVILYNTVAVIVLDLHSNFCETTLPLCVLIPIITTDSYDWKVHYMTEHNYSVSTVQLIHLDFNSIGVMTNSKGSYLVMQLTYQLYQLVVFMYSKATSHCNPSVTAM